MIFGKTAPDRITVTEYAESWEVRALIYAAFSSPKNISTPPDLSIGMKQLADPRLIDQSKADQLIWDLPGTAWLPYGQCGLFKKLQGSFIFLLTDLIRYK